MKYSLTKHLVKTSILPILSIAFMTEGCGDHAANELAHAKVELSDSSRQNDVADEKRRGRRRGNRDRIKNPGPQRSVVGQMVVLQLETTRPDDDDAYLFEASGLPAGLTLGDSNGLIMGTISESASPENQVTVVVREGDSPDEVKQRFSFVWTIEQN